MSMLMEMYDDLPPAAKRRLLLGWGPLLLVIILLCVFGGVPPTSWGLTLRFLGLGDALNNVPESTLSASLNALLIQSACTFVAWLLVILAVVSEILAFRAMQTQIRISRLQAKLAVPSGNAPAAAPAAQPVLVGLPPAMSAALSGTSMASGGAGMHMASSGAGVNMISGSAGMHMASSGAGVNMMSGGSAGMNMASADMDTVTPQNSPNYGLRVTIDEGQDAYPANPFVSMTAEAKGTKSQGVRFSSKRKDAEQEEDVLTKAKEQVAKQEEEEGPIFIYGNPFEGDLPEVFSYDKDLQKAVENLRNESASKEAGKGKWDLDDEDDEDTE